MKKLLAAGLVTTAMLATASGASADVTFGGNPHCDVYGTATFDEALTGTPGANTYHFLSSATGPGGATTACSGELNGVRVTKAPVVARVDGSGTLSCAVSQASGAPGTLTFVGTGQTLKFTLDIVGAASEVLLSVKGEKSGSGSGQATFRNDPDAAPDKAVATCGDQGFRALDFSAAFDSQETLVSSSPPPASTSGGGGSGGGTTGGGGSGTRGGPSGGGGPVASAVSLRTLAQKLRTALKKGVAVRLAGNVPARASLKALLDARTAKRYGLAKGRKPVVVASGVVALTQSGQKTGYLRLTSAAKRKLRKARRLRLKVTGTILDVTQRRQKVSKTVVLR
jgi:hypothetical protein